MSAPQLDDDQHAPLLPTSAPHPHGGSAEAVGIPKVRDTGTSWSTWQLKMTKSTGMISPYLQLALGMVLVVLLWAWWPFGGFGRGVDCVESDPAWPTNIGYAGPTPTGSEAFAAQTAYPRYRDTSPLAPPASLAPQYDTQAAANNTGEFNLLHKLGNLSPWRSVDHGLGSDAQIPDGCEIEQVQLLHRHGARYPTLGGGPADFAKKIKDASSFRATGELAFLNNFSYKLGAEILTPFGRNQLFSLGASFRVKYGHLLDKHPNILPVFRTETQDRMHKSALNFAAGFFGIPFQEQYHQLLTIEEVNFNNTLSPYMTCQNANDPLLSEGGKRASEWLSTYLADAVARFQPLLSGIELTVRDVWNMQAMCAYEIVALGGSEFCELFSEEEWEGFDYYSNLQFWYDFSFGQPAQAALGKGWVQEWLARTTNTPITTFDSTTNSSYHTKQYFPLQDKQSLWVDATHDTVISAVITTLGFESLTAAGPPPSTHIPTDQSFITSHVSPFASNLHSQIVSCPAARGSSEKTKWVRWVLNDGPVPLDHMASCATGAVLEKSGFCELEGYVKELQASVESIDWAYDCLGSYEFGSGGIMDGRPAKQ